MEGGERAQGMGGEGARTARVQRELAAARRLLTSNQNEVDEVLSAVADRLAKELVPVGGPGVAEERTPAASGPLVT
jgi:hypothetical protein